MLGIARYGALALLLVAAPASADEPEKKPRGPAEDLVIEASIGYGAGPFTAIHDRRPRIAHGPVYHFAVGWAWTVRSNQSLGVELFADGMFDSERITGGPLKLGGRYGAAAFVVGERAHVRVGGGYASSTYRGDTYHGLSVGFAAGGHTQMVPNATSWKRPTVTYDIVPSWDFLNAGSQTLHRWTIALTLGVAVY
jgi:hypothetical protein